MSEQIDPQTPGVVKGYVQHTQDEIDLVNEIKAAETTLAELWQKVRAQPATNKRMVAISRTEFETGFMWLVRAVFQPATKFDG